MTVVSRAAIAGDLDKGATAYNRGDYAATLEEWHPHAENGYAIVQYNLGMTHDKGRGVPMDGTVAFVWFKIAATAGNQNALNNRSIAHKDLPPK